MENVRSYGFCLSKDGHWRVAPEDRCAESVPVLAVLVAPYVRPVSAEDRGEVEKLARTVQAVIGDSVEIAWVDQGLPVLTEPLEHGADVF